jgi:hypothetical protein
MNKFFSYLFINLFKNQQKTLQKILQLNNCRIFFNNKWDSMPINGKKVIYLFGIICRLCTNLQVVSKEEDFYTEHKVDLIIFNDNFKVSLQNIFLLKNKNI